MGKAVAYDRCWSCDTPTRYRDPSSIERRAFCASCLRETYGLDIATAVMRSQEGRLVL